MIRFLTASACAGALAFAAAGAALADPPAAPASNAAAPVKEATPPAGAATPSDRDNEIVCVREDQTGSRVAARKVCMTRAQRAQRAKEAQQLLDDTRGRLGSAPQ